jgi:hypothetical protein
MKNFDTIIKILKEHLAVSYDTADGRRNSAIDEDNIITILKKYCPNLIKITKTRSFADLFILDDNGEWCPTNIKTTSCKCSDNAFNKLSFLWAFTDYDDFQRSKISDKKFIDAILDKKTTSAPKRKYYYLAIDKNNPSKNILIRDLLKINNFVMNANPNNILQIDWKYEFGSKESEAQFDECYDNLIIQKIFCVYRKKATTWSRAIEYR